MYPLLCPQPKPLLEIEDSNSILMPGLHFLHGEVHQYPCLTNPHCQRSLHADWFLIWKALSSPFPHQNPTSSKIPLPSTICFDVSYWHQSFLTSPFFTQSLALSCLMLCFFVLCIIVSPILIFIKSNASEGWNEGVFSFSSFVFFI